MKQPSHAARQRMRALFYSHDGLGLGHLRRTLTVAEALSAQAPGVRQLLMTGMVNADAFRLPQNLDFIRIPNLDKRHLFQADPNGEAEAPRDVFAVRAAVLEASVRSFAPHIVVVDHMPAGLAGELLPVLTQAAGNRSRPKFVFGMRDITYAPDRTRAEWARHGELELLQDVYDLILIYGSPQVFDPIKEYGLSPAVAEKTVFTGYLRRPLTLRPASEVRRELGAEAAPLVYVTAGGGADGAELLETFLEAIRAEFLPDVCALVVAGPHVKKRALGRLADAAADLSGVTVVPFLNDPASYISAADVIITMGGYNSVWEAIGSGKRPIVAPRHDATGEQLLRAERLTALGLAEMVAPAALTPQRLADSVMAQLRRPQPPAPCIDFDGYRRAGRALASLAEGRNGWRRMVRASPATVLASEERRARQHEVEIIVCVHNALTDVLACLASLARHTAPQHRLLVVDDASGYDCQMALAQFVNAYPGARLMRNEERQGYTRSANRGLRAAEADFVVLLNSDTVVTSHWLERLIECAESNAAIGIVGPLSNSAAFQSVPRRHDTQGKWARNPLPRGWSPDDMAAAIAAASQTDFPEVGVLNGFCLGIKRRVIDVIGYFDEELFPDGYGEEYDYCLRARKAGFMLTVADHAYVYHAGTRSYLAEQRDLLKQSAMASLRSRHSNKRIRKAIELTFDNPSLKHMRKAVATLAVD